MCRLHSLGLGDGVHGGREEGAVEGDLLGHLGLEGDFRGLQKLSPSCMLRGRKSIGEKRVQDKEESVPRSALEPENPL